MNPARNESMSEDRSRSSVADADEDKEKDCEDARSLVDEVPPNTSISAPTPAKPVASLAPDGGLKAWLQVLGCFFCWFNSWGLTNAFGVFQTYYEENLLYTHTATQISWIGSLQSFLLIFIGVITGPAYDAGYFYYLIWSGTFLVAFGYCMTSLCTTYWQVMLAQGVVVGLGAGCLFVPSVAILPQYFTRRRALANGIAACGSSMGGVIYPILFREMLRRVSFGWAVRILALFALVTCGIAIATLRVRAQPASKRTLFDARALIEPSFGSFTAGMFFGLAGLYIPTFYIEAFALQDHITSTNLAAYILPILNAGGVLGRIMPNFFADRTGPLNMLTPCVAAASVLAFGWAGVSSTAGLIVFALIYGFFSGAILSLPPVAVASLSPSLNKIGTRMGTSFAVAALGLLIGTPLSGVIISYTHRFLGVQMFAGAVLATAACFMLYSRIAKAGTTFLRKA